MSVTTQLRHATVVALVAAATFTAAPAVAHAAPADAIQVTTGRLVLNPSQQGYTGSLPVVVNYRGDQPAHLNLTIVEPVPGAFVGMRPSEVCVFGGNDGTGRRTFHCAVPGGEVRPGQRRRFAVDFRVVTTPRDYPMVAGGGTVEVQSDIHRAVTARAPFEAVFRSTRGTVAPTRPYVQDTRTDLTVTAGAATLTRQADGSFAGRVRVTARYGGDAPHYELFVFAELPGGVYVNGTLPEEVCAGNGCSVPGGRFMPGDTRAFDLLLAAPAGTALGALGSATVELTAEGNVDLPDVDPADDTATFHVTTVEAG